MEKDVDSLRRVLVLINPKSGMRQAFDLLGIKSR